MDKMIPMHENIIKQFFTQKQIEDRIAELGKQITEDYKPYQNDGIIVLCLLRGAFLFTSELVKTIDLTLSVDFIRASSYGNGAESSGKVEINCFNDYDYNGKHIIVTDDIVDSGKTLDEVRKFLYDRGAANVEICAMLHKHKDKYNLPVKYYCFDCPNEFIVGYGLDYMQDYRNLPYVGIVKPELYQKVLEAEQG